MGNRNRICLVLGLFLICWVAVPLPAQQVVSKLRDEISRLQKEALASPDSNTKAGLLKAIKRAEVAIAAGRDYLALEELATVHTMAQSLRDEQIKVSRETGMQLFEEAFKRAQPELVAADQRAKGRNWNRVPLAIRAIGEVSQSKIPVLLQAIRPYAAAAGPADGIFYIGEAKASVQTVDFAAALAESSPTSPNLHSILPDLQEFQTRINAAFKPPLSIQRHPAFIRLNSSLKMAFDLDAGGLYAGTMYQYLEAVRLFGIIETSQIPEKFSDAYGKKISQMHKRISSSNTDDTIALLFLQKAEAFASGREGNPPTADEIRNATVILEKVLPAYFAAQTATRQPVATKGKTITVTLVRWPYT